MFTNDFEYYAPTALEEALSLLRRYKYDAKVLAGGHSLLPMMKMRVAAPPVLVDINRIEDLNGWKEEQGQLRIGALTRHADLEFARELSGSYPLLAETARVIADPLVRNRGTVCGSLAHADMASDWGAAMIALRAEVEVAGETGPRRVPIDEFFVDTYTAAVEPGELVVAVRIPVPAHRVAARYKKLERKAGDFAIAAVAVQVAVDGQGVVRETGVGLCAVGAVPLRSPRAEAALAGRSLTADAIREAAAAAGKDAEPETDQRGSSDYKRDMVRVLVQRSLSEIAAELGIQ